MVENGRKTLSDPVRASRSRRCSCNNNPGRDSLGDYRRNGGLSGNLYVRGRPRTVNRAGTVRASRPSDETADFARRPVCVSRDGGSAVRNTRRGPSNAHRRSTVPERTRRYSGIERRGVRRVRITVRFGSASRWFHRPSRRLIEAFSPGRYSLRGGRNVPFPRRTIHSGRTFNSW